MRELSTNLVLNYLSNSLSDNLRDIKVFEHNAMDILSKMICKALEATNFIKDGFHYTLDLYQELVDSEIVEKLQTMYVKLRQDEPEDGYYHLYCGEDGPFSCGNYDDCYNDGFESGVKDGQLEILKLLFE